MLVRYSGKDIDVREVVAGRYENHKRVVIYKNITFDDGTTIQMPSILNGYLKRFKNNTSISSAMNAVNAICPFLNYCNLQVIDENDDCFKLLKEKGFEGLNLSHIASYLNYCIDYKKIKRHTALQYTYQLLTFYKYFIELGILDKNINLSYDKKHKIINPFTNARYLVAYPSKDRAAKRKLNNLDEHLWGLFLSVSEKVAPEITLGIAFQFFGGLRRGEIVNLALVDIIHEVKRDLTGFAKDSSKMDIVITDRQLEFFYNRDVDLSKCGVKKPGSQQVFNFNEKLYDYYQNHMKIRDRLLSKHDTDTGALFLNHDGQPMCGAEFERKWYKVKRAFLRILNEESESDYNELTSNARWGTHIGRGIFTNLCLTYQLASDVRTLANLRRDDRTESSQPYIDNFNISKQIVKTLNYIFSDREVTNEL